MKRLVIIGGSGSIGKAFVNYYNNQVDVEKIYCFSRTDQTHSSEKVINKKIDIEDEESIKNAAIKIGENKIDLVIVATGLLHTEIFGPEKSIKEIDLKTFKKIFSVNAFGPALIGKHFLPLLSKNSRSVLAFLSARVGSISENKIGGWYSYRSSKAALNQLIKNFSIEAKRINPNAIILGLQPGTVDSNLSKPFKKNVTKDNLFSADYSVKMLVDVIEKSTVEDSGELLAWDGSNIKP
tara:strand:- start:861 stop:1574 length:714 start_codon:yes stop_codon:yes gene_type:complete